MGVPSCCLCSSHDSGVSTPSAFSQSKNTLGRSLNQLEISFPRPNVKTILFPIPSLPPIYTQIRTSPFSTDALTRRHSILYFAVDELLLAEVRNGCGDSLRHPSPRSYRHSGARSDAQSIFLHWRPRSKI